MSTEYYRLKKPFTSARCTVIAAHTSLELWVNHAKAGHLTLPNEEVPKLLLALKRDDYALQHVAFTDGTIKLFFNDDDLDPQTTLISRFGELTCLREIDPTGELTKET